MHDSKVAIATACVDAAPAHLTVPTPASICFGTKHLVFMARLALFYVFLLRPDGPGPNPLLCASPVRPNNVK
jgi:hypothetical protein